MTILSPIKASIAFMIWPIQLWKKELNTSNLILSEYEHMNLYVFTINHIIELMILHIFIFIKDIFVLSNVSWIKILNLCKIHQSKILKPVKYLILAVNRRFRLKLKPRLEFFVLQYHLVLQQANMKPYNFEIMTKVYISEKVY